MKKFVLIIFCIFYFPYFIVKETVIGAWEGLKYGYNGCIEEWHTATKG